MNNRYAIFGAGRQGTASAYELIVHGESFLVTLFDQDRDIAESAENRVNEIIKSRIAGGFNIDVKCWKWPYTAVPKWEFMDEIKKEASR
jgi:hypothetical protein